MGRFIRAWMTEAEDYHVRLIVGGETPCFQSYCMDLSGASDPLNECYASVHMSGTLEPIDVYIKNIGLDGAVPHRLGAVFPRENLLTMYPDEMSMRYEDRSIDSNYVRLRKILSGTVNAVRVNTAVFFPSYQFMNSMLADDVATDLGMDVYYECRDKPQEELMEMFDSFKTSEGSVLFCITGGRISEGLDFPNKSLKLAILIGILYPKPTVKIRAMICYYDAKFGDGRLYVSIIPATKKIRQSTGA